MRTLEEIDRDIAIACEDARRMRHFPRCWKMT